MFSKNTLTAIAAALLVTISLHAQEKTPAFPGAEGFGRYVTGGRGGKVYHVTNLNDSGTGSLRWALGQNGTKTIVFDVSGTIHLKSALSINKGNVTIAGQTAPGDGICVADYPVSVSANNIIIRYMRFRLGNNNVKVNGADGWDALGGLDHSDIMIDHCSVSWSIDECLSFCGNKNITVQWCIVSQSLQDAGHSKGSHGYGGNWGGSGASFHHNLMAHHESRVPRLGPRYTTQLDERMDMRNNVFYNYAGNGCYGGEAMTVNIVNNYYKPGPGTAQIGTTKQKRIAAPNIRTTSYVESYKDYAPTLHIWGKYFVEGNVNPKYSDVTNNNWNFGVYNQITAENNDGLYNQEVKDSIRLAEPMDYILTTTHTAEDAYVKVLEFAGASLSRDTYDAYIVDETRNGLATYTGAGNHKGIIDSQEDLKPADAGDDWSAWPILNSTVAPTDTDGDGMPDAWETAHSLNPNDAGDGAKVGTDGYTNLETYLNSLVADITAAQNEGGTSGGSTTNISGGEEVSVYDISPETSNGDWTFNNGFSIASGGRGYAEGSSCGISGIKYSRNATYTINIPNGITITRVDVIGYSNDDSSTAYIEQFGSNTYTATDYVLPSRKGGVSVTHSINLAVPATSKAAFVAKDAQIVANLSLYSGTLGIHEQTITIAGGNDVYSLDGRLILRHANDNAVQSLAPGIYIVGHRKVVVK
ncbi:MAG: pectate lyase [Prevotella sp.]|nr:pectate lyase [Prevotella sp.]